MVEQRENEKQKNDELRLLYSACVSEIDSFKKQQWQVTNYGLLLFAAIVSIPKLLGTLNQVEYFMLFSSALSVVASGWYLVGVFADSIQVRRKRLTETRKKFTSEFMSAWRYGKTEAEIPDNPEEKLQLLWFFRAVLLAGFSATCLALGALCMRHITTGSCGHRRQCAVFPALQWPAPRSQAVGRQEGITRGGMNTMWNEVTRGDTD